MSKLSQAKDRMKAEHIPPCTRPGARATLPAIEERMRKAFPPLRKDVWTARKTAKQKRRKGKK
jgi:hypothetical protein